MKPRLLEYLRCPECRAVLALHDAHIETLLSGAAEVTAGRLRCTRCTRDYAIQDGVPRLADALLPSPDITERTASSFGFVWAVSNDDERAFQGEPHHFAKMEQTLGLPPPNGLILDAGCGEGIDVLQQARRPGCEVIGVELSDGGCATTFRRIATLPSAHVVQADLRRLPFADGTFDLAYSYGVLHHVADPPAAVREIARVTRAGGRVAAYLYEDFGERAPGWRVLLRAVNQLRRITVRLPHRLLYALCQIASPVVFVVLTLPSRLLSRLPACRGVASRMPYNFGTGPFSLVADLYDRFSAPLEGRYSREAATRLVASAGLSVAAVANNRGWMIAGEKAS
jgi:SAM-dependent methyltransferase